MLMFSCLFEYKSSIIEVCLINCNIVFTKFLLIGCTCYYEKFRCEKTCPMENFFFLKLHIMVKSFL